jgi:beta-N-acetylhexosaminidase
MDRSTPWAPADVAAEFGQLFLLAFDGTRLHDDVAEYLRTFRIGGVILFGDNYEEPAQMRALTSELQRRCASPERPLFIATDHEGGRVQRFKKGFTRLPPAAEMGRHAPASTADLYGQAAAELAAAGINFNLAPVADVTAPTRPGAVGDRSFSSDPSTAAAHVAAAVRGIQDQGLLACAKHFPGHGATSEDSHHVLPAVDAAMAELEASDLVPFRAAIAAGVAAVMPAHVRYLGTEDGEWPASLSPFWQQAVLRQALRFDGLIVSDAIEMKALLHRWSPVECGARALAAGTDILIYYKEAYEFAAFYDLRAMLMRGEIEAAPVARSLDRVRRAKQRLRPAPGN